MGKLGAALRSQVVNELSRALPDRVRLFWRERVIAPYDAGLYSLAVECAFRVMELSVVMNAQGGRRRGAKFKPAVQRLQSRGEMEILDKSFPGVEIWMATAELRDRASHYDIGDGPISVSTRAQCDLMLRGMASMMERLWAPMASGERGASGV